MTAPIPSVAHFVWLGPRFPWVNVLAVGSAALRGGFERVVLHCDHPEIAEAPGLHRVPKLELRPLDILPLLERARGGQGGPLVDIYHRLEAPAARSNLIRAALLDVEGGIYLDTDTITVADLTELRAAEAFCGEERIIFPATTLTSSNPLTWAAAGVRAAGRSLGRAWPEGWRGFRRIERYYPRGANNAVLASAPGGRFIRSFLDAMLALPRERITVRFALGPHLLQAHLRGGAEGLVVHPPAVFYPLPPVISQHWFRERRSVRLEDALFPETKVVHWYASVENRQVALRADPSYVRARAARQLFSALAEPFLDALEGR